MAEKKLIIAEKPMLQRAIADAIPGKGTSKDGYLVKGEYTIVSAFGHLLTLKDPEDYDQRLKKWSLSTLPIYFDDWGKKPGENKEQRLTLIGELLKTTDVVIHAGDPDDEGQYLIDEILKWFDYKGPVFRLATGDTTEAALRKALSNLKDNKEFEKYGMSAHARSIADIMVGYNFSRYFSLKNPHVKMLTVGRVQTPALGLVVNRDLQIENHEKQGYYTIFADLTVSGKKVRARFEPEKDDKGLDGGKITDKGYAEDIKGRLNGKSFDKAIIQRKEITEQPPLPFNLVKLQTYASNKFGYEPSKTLAITQSLRDNHNAITYNRSDCQYLSEEQFKESPETLKQVIQNLKNDEAGGVFSRLPIDTGLHSPAFNDKNITAHTAIIPQNRRFDVKRLTDEERNIYLAICKYFFAQFLAPALKERTSLDIALEEGSLKANSTRVVSDGYLKLIKPEKKKEEKKDDEEDETENILSSIEPGVYTADVNDVKIETKETKAPPRYTKASLNEDMTRIAKYVTDPRAKELLLKKDKEKKGENGSIGTSATRASIIDNLEARGFIQTKGKQIVSTALGRELYRILPDELKKPDMTGYWWAVQEEIQDGNVTWTALTDSVLDMIKNVIHKEYPKVDAYHVPENMRKGRLLLGNCPRCGRDIIEGNHGYGCIGYREGCTFVIKKRAEKGMMSKADVTSDMVHDLLSGKWIDEIRTDEDGNSCKTGRKRTENTICLKNLYSEKTEKKYPGMVYLVDDGAGSKYGPVFALDEIVKEPPESIGKCPRCGCDVIEGARGYGCAGYKDGCKFVIWKKSKQKFLANVTFSKTDAKKFLSEKSTHKSRLVDKKGNKFAADIIMVEEPENPFGPVFRVLDGTIQVKEGNPEMIKMDTVPKPQ